MRKFKQFPINTNFETLTRVNGQSDFQVAWFRINNMVKYDLEPNFNSELII